MLVSLSFSKRRCIKVGTGSPPLPLLIDPNTSYVPKHDLILKKNIVLPVLHPYMLVLVNLEELNMLKNLILINHDYNISLTHKDFPFEHNNN